MEGYFLVGTRVVGVDLNVKRQSFHTFLIGKVGGEALNGDTDLENVLYDKVRGC